MYGSKSIIFLLICLLSCSVSSQLRAAPTTATPSRPANVQQQKIAESESYIITDHYVNKWLPFPAISGKQVFGEETFSHKATKGNITVVYLIASWCIPCQKQIKRMRAIEQKFSQLHSDFIYIFAHDTRDDAAQFAKEHGLDRNAIMANHEILKDFHNPKLPTIYMSDRRTWLWKRYVDVKERGLQELERDLALMTSY